MFLFCNIKDFYKQFLWGLFLTVCFINSALLLEAPVVEHEATAGVCVGSERITVTKFSMFCAGERLVAKMKKRLEAAIW